ncbi:MAG: cytochrome c [Pseudomonadota bacterium]|nr:cytochrome c [Pseudomonadota bacterium]
MKRAAAWLAVPLAALLLVAAWLWQVNYRDGIDVSTPDTAPPATDAQRARGAYLARAGNCMACHTARGGAPGAGGVALATPFGTLYSSNLTPDPDTGIGRWNSATFWRALHRGRGADGRLLYPAFPYTHTTALTREDADALLAYFRSLPPVHGAPPAHQLRWPYSTQAALAVWRALYFRPGPLPEPPAAAGRDAAWRRGAYLVHAVAHCSACHATRDRLGGANWLDMGGGVMPTQGWYAPSMAARSQASVADWPLHDIVRLLKTGAAPQGSTSGPMAGVVLHGTQHVSDDDLHAMALYLQSLPQQEETAAPVTAPAAFSAEAADNGPARAGARLYAQHCADCHGPRGQGVPGAYPPLAGNRAVTMAHTDNLLQIVLHGGFAPATAGNPRPYGMPPFAQTLSDADIAAVLTHIRASWGNRAPEVSPLHVNRLRAAAASGVR